MNKKRSKPYSGHADGEQAAAGGSPAQRQQNHRCRAASGPPADHHPRSGRMASLSEIAAAGPLSFPTASPAASPVPQQQPAAAGASGAGMAAQQLDNPPPANTQQPDQHSADAQHNDSLAAGQPPAEQRLICVDQGGREQMEVVTLPRPDGRPVAALSWDEAQAIIDKHHKRWPAASFELLLRAPFAYPHTGWDNQVAMCHAWATLLTIACLSASEAYSDLAPPANCCTLYGVDLLLFDVGQGRVYLDASWRHINIVL